MAMLATVEAMQDGVLPTDDEHLETVAEEVRRLSRLVDGNAPEGSRPYLAVLVDDVRAFQGQDA